MTRAVIFDVDGTLVDSVDLHARAWQDAFRHYGKDIPLAEVRAQIGKGGDQLMPVFFSGKELRQFGHEMQKFRTDYQREYRQGVKAFPGVKELFGRIRADGRQIALASSAVEAEFRHNLDLLGVDGLVDAVVTGDDAARSKPHPDIFEAALDKLRGIDAGDAVAVGDSPYDAQAARKIPLTAIGVLCGGFPEGDLREAGCIEIYRDPEDLLRCYERSVLHH